MPQPTLVRKKASPVRSVVGILAWVAVFLLGVFGWRLLKGGDESMLQSLTVLGRSFTVFWDGYPTTDDLITVSVVLVYVLVGLWLFFHLRKG